MLWEEIVRVYNHDYNQIFAYYTEEQINNNDNRCPDVALAQHPLYNIENCCSNQFYRNWMAARSYKFVVGVNKYEEYKSLYEEVIDAYPHYVEPIYELCETAPSVIERFELYKKCLKCKVSDEQFRFAQAKSHGCLIETDPEILEWKALAGFLVESYNLEKYDEAHAAFIELSKTNVLDKVDEKYSSWVTHVKKCGNDAVNKLRSISSYAQFRWELSELRKEINGKNLIHFVWVQGHRTYSMIQYLAIRAARGNVNESQIYIYNDVEPENNKWWEKTKEYATIIRITPPRYINGRIVPHAQHVADIMRVCIIYELGGTYLDSDLLLTKDITDIITKLPHKCGSFVLTYNVNLTPIDTVDNTFTDVILCKETNDKLWNGFISTSKPRNSFLKRWILEYETKYGDPSGGCWWAGLSVETPMRLYKADCTDARIIDTHTLLPFGFYDDRIYTSHFADGDPYPISYGVHLWETEAEKRGVLPKNEEWFTSHPNTIFTYLFGKYV